MKLTVREWKEDDIGSIVDYFLESSPDFLKAMGADYSKLPKREEWIASLIDQFQKPVTQQKYYYIIWMVDQIPIGHSNINYILYGESALMHLHVWDLKHRQKGMGLTFLRQSIPYYFEKFKLKQLNCEPYAFNPAPNKTLRKLGFEFIRQYETKPGPINVLQMVNRYELTSKAFKNAV